MLNRFKNMIVLSAKSAEDLNEQLVSQGIMFDIVSMYGLNGRHYAYIVPDRPVKVIKKKRADKKPIDLNDIKNKLNKGK